MRQASERKIPNGKEKLGNKMDTHENHEEGETSTKDLRQKENT